MSWLQSHEILTLNRKKKFKISVSTLIDRTANIKECKTLEIGAHCRIDANAKLFGQVKIGRFTHIGTNVTISAGAGITFGQAVGISNNCYFFTNNADYKNESLSLPTIPKKYKRKIESEPITIQDHVIIGANSVVFPGSELGIGSKYGTDSRIKGFFEGWKLYTWPDAITINVKPLPRKIILNDYAKLLRDLGISS